MATSEQQPCQITADAPSDGRTLVSIPPSLDALGDLVVYITVGVGLLYSALTASALTMPGLLALVAANILWVGVYHWLMRFPAPSRLRFWGVVALNAAALLTLATTQLGDGLDWLLPIMSVAIVALTLPWRAALVVGIVLYALTIGSLFALAGASGAHDALLSSLTLGPAFIFCFIFTLVIHQQHTERQRAESPVAQLKVAQTQMRAYAAEIEDLSATRERNRMAREIHDTLGHYLTLLSAQIETAIKLEARESQPDTLLRSELTEARRVAVECLAEVRRSVAALRPTSAVAGRFDEALRRLVAEAQVSQPTTALTLDIEGETQGLSPELRVALYRCAQEALTNVRKHADARRALVRLRIGPQVAADPPAARHVELTIIDDGLGAAAHETADGADGADGAAARLTGFGLLGMRERIELLGGVVTAAPSGEHGWRVEVTIPFTADDAPAQPMLTSAGGHA